MFVLMTRLALDIRKMKTHSSIKPPDMTFLAWCCNVSAFQRKPPSAMSNKRERGGLEPNRCMALLTIVVEFRDELTFVVIGMAISAPIVCQFHRAARR